MKDTLGLMYKKIIITLTLTITLTTALFNILALADKSYFIWDTNKSGSNQINDTNDDFSNGITKNNENTDNFTDGDSSMISSVPYIGFIYKDRNVVGVGVKKIIYLFPAFSKGNIKTVSGTGVTDNIRVVYTNYDTIGYTASTGKLKRTWEYSLSDNIANNELNILNGLSIDGSYNVGFNKVNNLDSNGYYIENSFNTELAAPESGLLMSARQYEFFNTILNKSGNGSTISLELNNSSDIVPLGIEDGKFGDITVTKGNITASGLPVGVTYNVSNIKAYVKLGDINCTVSTPAVKMLQGYKTKDESCVTVNKVIETILKEYVEGIKEEIRIKEELANKINPDEVDDAADNIDTNTSALQAWNLVVNNFFATGHTYITDDDKDLYNMTEKQYNILKHIDLKDYGYSFIKKEFTSLQGYGTSTLTEIGSQVSLNSSLTSNPKLTVNNYELTPYEDFQLRVYFNIQAQYRVASDDAMTRITTAIDKDSTTGLSAKFAINKAYTASKDNLGDIKYFYKDMSPTDTTFPDLPYDGQEMRSTANKAAGSGFKNEDPNATPNARLLAQNFEAVTNYILFGILDVDMGANYSQDTTQNTLSIQYNENAMKIIPNLNLDSTDNGVVASDGNKQVMRDPVDYTSFGLPDIPNMTKITNNEFSRTKASQLYLSLMYLKQYASVPKEKVNESYAVKTDSSKLSGLQLADGKTCDDYSKATYDLFTNPVLDSYISENAGKTDLKLPTEVGVYVRAYTQIHDGLDYLGFGENIKDNKWFSPELIRIYEYYDDISAWKDLVAADEYNPSDLVETQPFGEFFSLTDDITGVRMFSDYINKGIAASATYLPLVTNTFDYDAIDIINDNEFVKEFHYKYGFHRKALFIDTNTNSALQSYVTGQRDSLRVATLEDMMQPEKDIVLYVDTNFYNIKELAEKQNLSYNKLQNTEEAGKEDNGLLQNVADMWSEWRNLDATAICKTAGNTLYSDALGNAELKAYGTDRQGNNFWNALSKDHYILSSDAIDEYYKQDEYSDTQSFAFVSGIYRNVNLLTICQAQSANPKPVFVSSPTLPFVDGIQKKEFNSIYNYLMVKNLKANLGLDYKTGLDLESPLFIDVYGNISTQSGTVVIPAASNATLYEPDKYSIVTAGLTSLAGNINSWTIPEGLNNVDTMLDSGFQIDPNSNSYKMQNKTTTEGVVLNFNNLPLQSDKLKKILYNDAYVNCSGGINGTNTFEQRVNTIMEVMRGAPIENINFEQEGLSGQRNIDTTGIYIAYRIEELGDMLLSSSEGNSLLRMPNLAFMTGVEYIVVFIFKALVAVGLIVLMLKIYADGAVNSIGISTVVEFIVTIASIVIGVIFIPTLINYSYYQTNKNLLQDEAAYMLILDTEKKAEGKEVGMRDVRPPSSTSEFYIKLNDIKVPWWSVLQDIYSSDMFARMADVYDKSYSESIYSTFDGAIKKGNGIYVSTDDLFKTSEIRYDNSSTKSVNNYYSTKDSKEDEDEGFIYQAVKKENKMSYVLPYYVLIDKMLYDVQKYNDVYSSSAYRTKIMQNGNVRTIGLLESYFTSNEFLQDDEHNLFGFYDMYQMPYSASLRENIFSDEDIESMKSSLWYNKDAFTAEEVESKLKELDEKGKEFIVNNRTLLNKVTDETFIKVFALYMSVEHNELFKVPAARGIELTNVDTKDIIRLSLAPKSDVMHSISMSFGRFTYTQSGTFGTILMAFLLVVYYFTSLIRPTIMIVLVTCLIFSYVYKKLMRNEQNHSGQGYIVSCALICLVNIIYAFVIKLSVLLPNLGADPIISILMQMVLQAVYVGVLSLIGYIVTKNVTDIGYFGFKTIYDAHMANKVSAIQMSVNKVISKSFLAPLSNTSTQMISVRNGNKRTAGLTGNDIMERLRAKDDNRHNDVFNNRERRN